MSAPKHADDAVWKALADPARRSLLDLLRAGPRTTGDLAGHFEQTRFGVMKHLEVLHEAGLIGVERRGRERWNHLNAAQLQQAVDRWITPFQRSWTRRWANLQAHLAKESDMPESNQDPAQSAGAAAELDIRQQVRLPAPVEQVFRALTEEIDRWWAPPYRQTAAPSTLRLEPRIGAAMIETARDGHAVIWAHVEEIHVPHRLYLAGRFAVRGAIAGSIHYDLQPAGAAACELTLVHQACGPIAAEARERFAQGWADLLDTRLRQHLARRRA